MPCAIVIVVTAVSSDGFLRGGITTALFKEESTVPVDGDVLAKLVNIGKCTAKVQLIMVSRRQHFVGEAIMIFCNSLYVMFLYSWNLTDRSLWYTDIPSVLHVSIL